MEHYIKVSCSGFNLKSAHPKIYLVINKNTSDTKCPYCFKNFEYKIESNNENI